jgi:glycine cleavage system H protein
MVNRKPVKALSRLLLIGVSTALVWAVLIPGLCRATSGKKKYRIPDNLLYNREHFWFKIKKHKVTIGLTPYGLDYYGRNIWLPLPPVGEYLEKNQTFDFVETNQGLWEVSISFSGKVINSNLRLRKKRSPLTKDPYGKGWLIKLEWEPPYDKDAVLTAKQYRNFINKTSGNK